MLEQAKDNETCDTQCFLNSIIWHNNTYYFELALANMTHDDLKMLIPGLQCVLVDSFNGGSYDCSWYEWVNWKYIKTWKSWVEQLFPDWSFEFFDIELDTVE
jgi:Uma2 family endonuclease